MLRPLINMFYPSLCAGCRHPLTAGQAVLCVSCRLELPYIQAEADQQHPVVKALWGRVPLQFGVALLYYQKHTIVQKLLHELKYKRRKEIGSQFGTEIAKLIINLDLESKFDAVVPVPMHISKYKTRGYNQSELLASQVAQLTQKPLVTGFIRKVSATATQTKKGRFARWQNMAETFALDTHITAPGSILLVDDVITTGATLEACANTILGKYPQTRISVAALAHAYH